MNSPIFQYLGIANLDIAYLFIAMFILFIITFILIIIFIVKHAKLKKKYDAFMLGKDASSLEEEIANLFQNINKLKEDTDEHDREIRHIYKRLETTYQKIGIVKYDAFHQMGGKLSFCLVLLDENNNGFVMNSVHSSEGCYCYTKVIKEGISELDLGNEEEQALKIAMREDS